MTPLTTLLFISLLAFTQVAFSIGSGSRHEGHKHHIPGKDRKENMLKDKDILRDYEHIKEDLQDLYNEDFSEQLDDTEMEKYYFQLHDLDGDRRLDGLELLGAINHVHVRDEEDGHPLEGSLSIETQKWWNEKFEEDAEMIDQVMKEEDLDEDGYISYLEFALGREKERD